MIRNYSKTALRNMLKNKTITLIDLIGLAVGLASVILILTYINNELSFDRFHKNEDRIYRGVIKTKSDNGIEISPQMIAAVGPALSKEFPEIEKVVRFRYPESKYFGRNNTEYFIKNVLYADSTLFDVFSFPLLSGNPKTALSKPYSVVLSAGTAEKMFGKENPIGEMITLDNKELLTVTGVVEDAPVNSHIQYNALISFVSLYENKNMFMGWNGGWAYYTYILISPKTNIKSLDNKMTDFMDRHLNVMYKGSSWYSTLFFQPLKQIYLHSNLSGEIGPTGNISYLFLFGFIALLIFVIACINFINLTAARLTGRLRETGTRKILGASRADLFLQFTYESGLINLVALLISLILVESCIPYLNNFLGLHLVLYQLSILRSTLIIITLIVVLGIFSGNYPALYLSSIKAIDSIKNVVPVKSGKINLRTVTVLLQYTISIAMIICTLFLFKQLYFVKHKEPGFNRKEILVLPLTTNNVRQKINILKSDFLNIPGVEYVSACSECPGTGLTKNGYKAEGQSEYALTNVLDGDDDLVKLLGLKIVKGRDFSKSFATDETGYLINESYLKKVNWNNPIGKFIERNGQHEVIGVVGDFNFASLHEPITPLIITMKPEGQYKYLLIRSVPSEVSNVLNKIKNRWTTLIPEIPFDFFFLDDAYRNVYSNEQNLSNLFLLFTFLAISIAFLGLFGLASFETERKSKSIGIRKTNGAKTRQIMFMLSTDFTKWVVLAFVVACPIAWFAMNKWLQNFAYKTDLSWWVFALAGIITLIIALLTVSWQSWRAANRNPVEALRYE